MKQKGFTLIELLVVIAIIGILAMVVFVNLTASRVKSRDARRLQDVRNIQTALQLYNDDCGQYPAAWSLTESSGCNSPTTLASFLPVLPKDPSTQSDYSYTYDSSANTYTLIFVLESTANGMSPGAHTLTQDSLN